MPVPAFHLEVKKDRMNQKQSGEWTITFTLHPHEMPPMLMNAAPGTKYMLALAEIGDNGEPVERPPASKPKEVMPNSNGSERRDDRSDNRNATPPRPAHGDPKPAGAEKHKRPWNELAPAQQAGIVGGEKAFWDFMTECHEMPCKNKDEAADAIRTFCGVGSRKDIAGNHHARILLKSLISEYWTWAGPQQREYA